VWSPLDALVGVPIAATLTVLLVSLVIGIAGDDGLDFTLGSQAALEISLVTIGVGAATLRGAPDPLAALGFRRPPPRWIRKVGLTFLAYLGFTLVVVQVIGEPEQRDIADTLGFHEGVFGAIATGALIVVIAPICEEMFFRGFFFAGLRSRLPFVVAALISAVLFGAVHTADVNAVAALQLTAFGAALAWLYEETGSLWASISLHMVNNAIAFTILVTN
jgi:membrane protease YdiL (CAAX protease family)